MENEDFNNKTNSLLYQQLEYINKILEKIQNSNCNVDDAVNFMGMVNDIHKSNKSYDLIKSINNTNYNSYEITISQSSIDTLNDTINSIFGLQKQKLKYKGFEFTIYEDNDVIPNGTKYLAIKQGHHLPSEFPNSIEKLLLPDGFNQSPFDRLHERINDLIFFNIKLKLKPGDSKFNFSKII